MDWKRIKRLAEPGDVLLLRREFPEEHKQCVVDLIHLLGETYDHAAIVMKNKDRRVLIAHATKDDPTVTKVWLDDYPSLPFCVKAELRRHSSKAWGTNPKAERIVRKAKPKRWRHAQYAYGDLLLAGLAATRPGPAQDPHTIAVLRSRVLALCIAVLESEADTVAVTCASFVNACHDRSNKLATKFPTIDKRLKELARGSAGGADWSQVAQDEIDLCLSRLRDEETPVYALMNRTLCPDSVTADDRVPEPDLITYYSLTFLRRMKEHLKAAAPARKSAYATTSPASVTRGVTAPKVMDADRLLVTIEDLRTDANLVTVETHFKI